MIYLLPGMGATSAMYDGPWLALDSAKAIDWPAYNGETTLSQVADRIISEHGIQPQDSLVGSSLGGLVGLEIHAKLSLRRIALISGAISPEEINPLLRSLAPLAEITPMRLIQHLAGKSAHKLSAMFAEVDARFIRAMCMAVSRWRGYDGCMDAVFRIHGDRDHVIRCPKNARVISGGGHLITMTHASDCINALNELSF